MQHRYFLPWFGILAGSLFLFSRAASAAESANPYVGHWALTIPGGGAGWLGVTEADGKLSASILWGGGSVLPVNGVKVVGDQLLVTRISGNRRDRVIETITATRDGDNLKLSTVKARSDGSTFAKAEFTGKRTPPLPPAPDLASARFGEPIRLFNGKNLDGWELTDPHAASGWSVNDGILNNNPVQTPGKPHKNYGNLRTNKEFEDFRLTLETNLPKGSNSGIYLRGIYEIQVVDSYGRPLDPHNMGAVYSRITPSKAAEKPAGQWQTFDITLIDRHVTVILNGTKIIDNQPVLGCTGGALWSDPLRPGPIYLQGDHSGANYRNIVLRPLVR
jgi:hypothetical protein